MKRRILQGLAFAGAVALVATVTVTTAAALQNGSPGVNGLASLFTERVATATGDSGGGSLRITVLPAPDEDEAEDVDPDRVGDAEEYAGATTAPATGDQAPASHTEATYAPLSSFTSQSTPNTGTTEQVISNTLSASVTVLGCPTIDPTEAHYDLAHPADVATTINWGAATYIDEIEDDLGRILREDRHYTLEDDTLTILDADDFLGPVLTEPRQELELTIHFDFCDPVTFTITAIETPMVQFAFNGVPAPEYPDGAFEYCYGEELVVTLNKIYSGVAPFTITWEVAEDPALDGEATVSEVGDILFSSDDLDAGTYTIQVTSIVDDEGYAATQEFLDLCKATVTILQEPMISFGFNDVEAGHNAEFEYEHGVPVEVTLYAIYGGEAPFEVTYRINDEEPQTADDLYEGSVIAEAEVYEPGIYEIVVTSIVDAHGCEATQEFLDLCTATVTIIPELAVQGETREVNSDILPGVTVTLYQNDEPIASTESDEDGYYILPVPEFGEYTVEASKEGFIAETQTITVDEPITYTVDFISDSGLIPEEPDHHYVLACISVWKTGEPPYHLTHSRVLAVISVWKSV